jgi:hypothetical protein
MIKFFVSVIFTLIGSILIGCENNSSEKTAETLLKNFYTEYMTLIASNTLDSKKEEFIKQKYCTKELLNKINKQFEEEELDYDPFLKAQDANLENLSSLKIENVNKDNQYKVRYIDNYSLKKIEINIQMNDSLKIKSVW